MRKSLLGGVLLVLMLTQFAGGGPVEPFAAPTGFRNMALVPFGTQLVSLKCKANERACAVVYGQGTSPMGLYVFDAVGNCVAWDDLSQGVVTDDLAAEWFPAAEEVYDIEVRNLGRRTNSAEFAIH